MAKESNDILSLKEESPKKTNFAALERNIFRAAILSVLGTAIYGAISIESRHQERLKKSEEKAERYRQDSLETFIPQNKQIQN